MGYGNFRVIVFNILITGSGRKNTIKTQLNKALNIII